MRFIPRTIKRIGAIIVGLISLLPVRTHSKTDPGAEELSYQIDTQVLSAEDNADCDPGNYRGKGSLDVSFTVVIPKEEGPTETHVSIGAFGHTKVMLKQPIPLGKPFDLNEVVTVKYPVIKARSYEVSASGTLDEKNIDTQIKMRRLGKPKAGKQRFCLITLRIKNAGRP